MVSGELEPKLDWVSGLAGRSWLIPERDWRGGWGLAGDSLGNGSRAAERPQRRGVLQVDYSADELPEPLRWLEL